MVTVLAPAFKFMLWLKLLAKAGTEVIPWAVCDAVAVVNACMRAPDVVVIPGGAAVIPADTGGGACVPATLETELDTMKLNMRVVASALVVGAFAWVAGVSGWFAAGGTTMSLVGEAKSERTWLV